MQPFATRSTIAAICGALLLLLGCASDPVEPRETDDDSDDSEEDESSPSTQSDASSDRPSSSNRDGGPSMGSTRDAGGSSSSGGMTARDGGPSNSGGGGNGQCKLTPNEDGWVAQSTNDAKVQGAFYTYASDGSTIEPLTTATNPFKNDGNGKLCVKGSAAVVVDMMYSKYFGAGMAFDVCAPGGAAGDTKYTVSECPGGLDLVGIKFTLSGKSVPSELRVTFHEAMRDESAYVLAKSGANEALIADATVAYMPMAPAANAGKVDAVHFAIPTNEMSETPFDFCVEDIRVLTKSGPCADGEATPSTGGGSDSGSGTRDAGAGTTGGTDAGSSSDAGSGDDDNNNGGGSGGMCARSGTSWSTTEQYGIKAYGKYKLRNNYWNMGTAGAGQQSTWGNGPGCWGVTAQHSDQNPKGRVKSYPNIMRGWGIHDDPTPNSGFPIRVSEIRSGKIRWKMKASNDGRMWGLWDIYFHESATAPSKNAQGNQAEASVNLMIQQYIVEDQDRWMIKDSESWKRVTIGPYTYRHRPTNPSGSEQERGDVSNPSWSRNQIKLYVDDLNGNTLGKQDMTIDLKEMIDWAIQEGSLKETDYLIGIQAGWEIVAGGTYVTEDFWTSINGEPQGN